jgi:hypothetical protein
LVLYFVLHILPQNSASTCSMQTLYPMPY